MGKCSLGSSNWVESILLVLRPNACMTLRSQLGSSKLTNCGYDLEILALTLDWISIRCDQILFEFANYRKMFASRMSSLKVQLLAEQGTSVVGITEVSQRRLSLVCVKGLNRQQTHGWGCRDRLFSNRRRHSFHLSFAQQPLQLEISVGSKVSVGTN